MTEKTKQGRGRPTVAASEAAVGMSLSVPSSVRDRIDQLTRKLGHKSRSETCLPWIISKLEAAEKRLARKAKK